MQKTGKIIQISPPEALRGTFTLPASKSEANRALIIRALSQGRIRLENLSSARDTQTLQKLLQSDQETLDVGDAGTVMRFMTAFLAFQPQDRILTGTARMLERPIGPLVEALKAMGADIHYLKKEGYPPLYLFGRNAKFGASTVKIPGNISSQYISALLMIAPSLPEGLRIEIQGKILSRPYIQMTLNLMRQFGIEHSWEGNTIGVKKQFYQSGTFHVESDWSAASYPFSMVGLSEGGELFLPGLKSESLQGDRKIVELMRPLGVEAGYSDGGWHLRQVPVQQSGQTLLNLADCPDLAQTLVPYCAAKGIPATFTGLETLRIKETDRILALQTELAKFGIKFEEMEKGNFALSGSFSPPTKPIETYADHRMAMGFAPLAQLCPGLKISEPQVVEKSFPAFWRSMQAVGFEVLA